MTKLKGGVGKGKMNDPLHVAVLQMCLKVLKRLQGYPGGRRGDSYYTGDIDGVYRSELIKAVNEAVHDGRLYARSAVGDSKGEGYISEGHTVQLLGMLPTAYRGLEYHLTPKSDQRLVGITPNVSGVTSYRETELNLPKEESERLVRMFKRLAGRFNIVAVIEKISVTIEGRFLVRLSFKGGRWIDKKTANIVSRKSDNVSSAIVLDFLKNNTYSPLREDASIWGIEIESPIVLGSIRHYEHLKISDTIRNVILSTIKFVPPHKTEGEASLTRCVAAYERARVLGKVEEKDLEFFKSCFGASAGTILDNERARKARCFARFGELKRLLSDRDKYRSAAVNYGNKLASLQDSENEALIRKVVQEFSGIALGKVGGAIGKAAARTKVGRKVLGESKDAPTHAERVGDLAGSTLGGQDEGDSVDTVLLVGTGAAIVVGIFLGPAAWIVTITLLLIEIVGILKAVYDVVAFYRGRKKAIKETSDALYEAMKGLNDAMVKLHDLLEVMIEEGSFTSFADYDFLPASYFKLSDYLPEP